jgi:hypothetical protein
LRDGGVLVADFTVAGIPCIGLNDGPTFKHNEPVSFQIATDQAQTDRLWNAIVRDGGERALAAGARTEGRLLADHAARADPGDGGRRCRGQAGV